MQFKSLRQLRPPFIIRPYNHFSTQIRCLTRWSRQPQHHNSQKIQLTDAPITRTSTPVRQGKGQEHLVKWDLDYLHIRPEDENIGLAFIGVHPSTNKMHLRQYIAKIGTVRQCWLYSGGVVLARFESEGDAQRVRTHFEQLERYPLPLWSSTEGGYTDTSAIPVSPPKVEPLTLKYQYRPPPPSTVLLLRASTHLSRELRQLLLPYTLPRQRLDIQRHPLLSHNARITEWYIQFATKELAIQAQLDLHEKAITIPAGLLSKENKLSYPVGMTCHLWVQFTGLDEMPPTPSPPSSTQTLRKTF